MYIKCIYATTSPHTKEYPMYPYRTVQSFYQRVWDLSALSKWPAIALLV